MSQDVVTELADRPLLEAIATSYNYWITIFLMVSGLYIVVARSNMIKSLVGLGIFQTSVYLLYLSPGKILGGTAPILTDGAQIYSNPLPHVLILTAIVVGVATLALGLALTVRVHEAYGTIEEDEITLIVDREDYAEAGEDAETTP
ncbi:MAG: cation:proton antiporter subunit C [Pseudomonadota bacterium]